MAHDKQTHTLITLNNTNIRLVSVMTVESLRCMSCSFIKLLIKILVSNIGVIFQAEMILVESDNVHQLYSKFHVVI